MDSKELLKKYWFLGLIGVCMVVFLVGYGVNAIKNSDYKVKSLQKDGKDVVISINDEEYYFADDLYKDMHEVLGASQGFVEYYKAVIDKAVETTKDLSNYAANMANYYLQTEDNEQLLADLKSAGYSSLDDLTAYFLNSLKYSEFMHTYYTTNYDKFIKPLIESELPRKVSHIIVKVANIETITDSEGNKSYKLNPTEEESKKINDALEALKTQSFEEVAKAYSEDGSATSGGLLGTTMVSNPASYAPEFQDACFAQELNTVSGIVESQFGYHIIKVDEMSDEDLFADTYFNNAITSTYPNQDVKAIVEKGNELGFVIKDETINNYVESLITKEAE